LSSRPKARLCAAVERPAVLFLLLLTFLFATPSRALTPPPTQTQQTQQTTRDLLHSTLADPDLDVLLLIAGLLLLYLEFNAPGSVLPGALGLLCILLAFSGFSQLPIHPAALALLGAAVALILLEIKLATHGLFAVLGTLLLSYGLFTLVEGAHGVHASTAIAAGIAFGGITFALAWLGLLARRNKSLSGPDAMLGLVAIVRSPLSPSGQVEVRGEIWNAILQSQTSIDSGPPSIGDRVVVTAVNRLTLTVRPLPAKV
jgi:membrane-bound serine protease (ClpP class)